MADGCQKGENSIASEHSKTERRKKELSLWLHVHRDHKDC